MFQFRATASVLPADPVAQVQHPVTPDDHVRVLQQVLALDRPEVAPTGAEHDRHDVHRDLVDQAFRQRLATDLAGRTVWPADREIERFPLGVDLTLGAYAVGGSVIGRPVVFTAEQFDTLSVGEIIVGDIRDGTSETLSVENFLGLACQPR